MCDQLTVVKTGNPLASITWPYHGLNCWPIEVNVIRWQVTSFQMIAGSRLSFLKIQMKYVVFMCRTIKILISNWPRTQKFRQLLKERKTVTFDFAYHGHALVTLYFQFLCSDWSNLTGESWGKFRQHLESVTKFCVNLSFIYLSFSTGCTKWNSAAIRSLPLFMASLFIGFLVVEKYVTCPSRKSDIWWHRFRFSPCLMRTRV